jgi:hypothetical protein
VPLFSPGSSVCVAGVLMAVLCLGVSGMGEAGDQGGVASGRGIWHRALGDTGGQPGSRRLLHHKAVVILGGQRASEGGLRREAHGDMAGRLGKSCPQP